MQPSGTTAYATGAPTAQAGGPGPVGVGPGPCGVGPPGSVFYVPVMAAPTGSSFYERYLHRQSMILGVGSVLIGILCIVFNAVGMAFALNSVQGTLYIGHGFWSGILFIVTGSLGIRAGMIKRRCQIVGFMVTCIFSAICAVPLLTFAIIGATLSRPSTTYDCRYQYNGYTGYNSCNDMVDTSSYRVVVAMQALLAVLSFAEAVIAIWGSAICCQAVCCCTPQPQTVMVASNYFANDGQVVYMNQPTNGLQYTYSQPPTAVQYHQGHMPPPAYQQSYVHSTWNSSPQSMPISTVSPSAPLFDVVQPPPYLANGPPVDQSTETVKY